MMRGLPFWLSLSILVVLWVVFFTVLIKYVPHLRLRTVKRALYALLCAVAGLALIGVLMKMIVVFFN